MAKFEVKSHLLHEGVMHKPGSEVELNPKEIDIDRLIELKVVEPLEEEKPKKGSKQKADENPGE